MGQIMSKLSKTDVWRWIIISFVGAYLLIPIFAMLEFSTRGAPGERSAEAWVAIPTFPKLLSSIFSSLQLAVVVIFAVVFILVPTMIWIHLRLPHLRRIMELICLLPLTIPAIVIVVGIAPTYRAIYQIFGSSPLTLSFVYFILVLPYSYRSISASLFSIDTHTLSEASRSLGASTIRMISGIIVPNIKVGIMSGAVISIALVLGEFTISNLLNFETMQVVINLLGKRDAATSVAVSLAALVFAFILLAILPTSNRSRSSKLKSNKKTEVMYK
jgi:putative spermidine/putrescine transport system permease protein